MDLRELTLATFEPLVGERFAVQTAAVDLVLDAAAAIGAWPGGRDPFRLAFRGPREPLLAQATYGLEHAALGTLEIFIVPIGQGEDHTTYEAIFT